MPQALIVRTGRFLEISQDGEKPLPQEVLFKLEAPLWYYEVHADSLFNGRGGSNRQFYREPRRLFVYDNANRFICGRGYLARMKQLLSREGYSINFMEDPTNGHSESAYEEDWDRVVRNFSFRPGQEDCLVAIASNECGLIDAPTAFGKMWIIAMVCNLYKRAKIDVVVKSVPVFNSIYRLLVRTLPNIGKIGDGFFEPSRITVVTADSLHRTDGKADILLLDEVHQLVTTRYVESLSHYRRARTFGFSASSNTRFDGLHARLEGVVGPTIFKMTYQQAEQLGLVVPIVVQWIDVTMDKNPVANVSSPISKQRHGIWRNSHRNQLIAAAARSCYDSGKQVLITVSTVEHGAFLKRLLPEFALCYAPQDRTRSREAQLRKSEIIDSSLPEMTAERLEKMRLDFETGKLRGAIATSVWSVGVSFDSLEVLIRAEGSASATASIQTPGRISRVVEGKSYGLLIDMMDLFDATLERHSLKRRRSYAERGWVQLNDRGEVISVRTNKNDNQLSKEAM